MIFVCLLHRNKKWSGSRLIELAKGCRKLKTLILSDCQEVSDADIGELFTYCTQLTCLDIRNCQRFSGECLETGVTAALRRLYIDDCHMVRSLYKKLVFVLFLDKYLIPKVLFIKNDHCFSS